MKNNKRHIILTWVLLACFIVGQVIVYAHNHGDNTRTNKSVSCHRPETQPKQTLTENCRLCDAMHHNTMTIQATAHFAPVAITNYFYKAIDHDFISISLILSAGRSPPLS